MPLSVRSLGPGGPPLTRWGLGMAALGRPAYINVGHAHDFPGGRTREAMAAQSCAVLDLAYELGIRYFDAARSYGEAERFLRSWLDARSHPPGSAVVGSKWGYTYTADFRVQAERHEVKDHSLAALQRQVAESRAVLGDHLALYHIHSATPETRVLEDEAVLDELARLRNRGLYLGVSVSGVHQADMVLRAIEIHRDGRPLFSTVQATWNLLERSCESALRDAHAAGMRVIVKEVLANGLLTERGDVALPPALRTIARVTGATLDALALAAALSQPWADVVLLGAATQDQLRSNFRAHDLILPPDVLTALEGVRMLPQAYWAERAKLPWN